MTDLKRHRSALALWLTLAAVVATCAVRAEIVPPAPTIKAAAAILVQAQSGAVLYEKNAFEARPPASLTKMVAALVVVDRCSVDDMATVSERAAAATGSSLGLKTGETISVGELLKGLMLPSGNDAAACLAEHVAGSEAAFAELMNQKAAELNAVNTHFVNASGLTAEGHYSCARDLAVFGLAVRLHPYLGQIIKHASATVRWSDGRTESVKNLNRLLARCEGCDGVKTGFTTPAGRCLVASAERHGYSLMSVVLKSPDSWTECGRLLNWGFGQPPVGVVAISAPGAAESRRFAAPLVEGRLHVPADDFMRALGCPVRVEPPNVTAGVGEQTLVFSPTDGLTIEGQDSRPELAGVVWRNRVAVPGVDLCRLLGLQLRFDKQTLTAHVGPPTDDEPDPPASSPEPEAP